jgi:hypothetical protein
MLKNVGLAALFAIVALLGCNKDEPKLSPAAQTEEYLTAGSGTWKLVTVLDNADGAAQPLLPCDRTQQVFFAKPGKIMEFVNTPGCGGEKGTYDIASSGTALIFTYDGKPNAITLKDVSAKEFKIVYTDQTIILQKQ